ncbi:hypothetical protein [Rickettsiella endosymbiont of Miltochrista miniata]|uniref:hypothetical protein n=1 Tax=Rickettsiella endosymbiont of Miltochrista miniata TaxID=3066239 RepID=UPI00313E8FCA
MPELKIKSIQVEIGRILSAFERHLDAVKKLRDKHNADDEELNRRYGKHSDPDEYDAERARLASKHIGENKNEKNLFNGNLQKLSLSLKEFINLNVQLMELLPKLSFIEISALLFVLEPDQQEIALTHLNEQSNTAIITANEYKQLKNLKNYNPSEHSENNKCWQAFCSNKIAPYEQQAAEKRKQAVEKLAQEEKARLSQERQQIKAAEEARKIKFDQRVQSETTLKNDLEQIMQQVKGKEWQTSGVPSFFRNQSYGQYRSLQQWRPNTIRSIEKLLNEESKMPKGYTNYSKVEEKMILALESVTKQPHSFWNSFVIGRSNDTIQAYETILQSLKSKASL